MQEAKFSANFKKYRGETDVLFTVRSDETADQHLESVIQYFGACDAHGFRDKPGANGKAGLAEGEESWPVDGYVVGPAKQRDGSTSFVLWMYGRGKYKTASIYHEKWDRLMGWFAPDTSKVWPTNQAPEADAARSSGFFVSVPEREIVLQSYTNREGQNRRAFDRVLGNAAAKPPAAEPPVAPAASSEAARQQADNIINAVQQSATTPELLVKYGNKAELYRKELGSEWTRVQNVFRSKLTPMRYQFTRESMLDAIERLRQVIGEVHYKDLKSSFEDAADDDLPF